MNSNQFNTQSNLFPTSRSNGFNRILQNTNSLRNRSGSSVGGGMSQPLPGNNP
ncbi:MAG TPA: hypothetical protein VIV82_01540 [Verrucomicrobiae bacterium]